MAVVAIDGPAGAGKSTVARLVAARIGIPYLDTGAMYRCVALSVLNNNIDLDDETAIAKIAQSIEIVLQQDLVTLDGKDVTHLIREPHVGAVVSIIAAMPPVRDAMRSQQQQWIASHGGGVVEGRDIGTVVFPHADVKIFLTASADERAARRVAQTGGVISDIAHEIKERDRIDATRQDSPMVPAHDAVHVDSTGLDVEDVIAKIVGIYSRIKGNKHG